VTLAQVFKGIRAGVLVAEAEPYRGDQSQWREQDAKADCRHGARR
jgi:hypothetical protein